jgi:hypothetical protein
MTYTPGPNDVAYGVTPPATGTITVPQSPSGAITQNTGRSESATETFVSSLVQTEQQGTPILSTAPMIAGTGPQPFYSGNTSGVTP